MAESKQTVLGIIPARYASSRFPGKPLAPLAGKTLIQQTYENACRCKTLDHVLIATDDDRILDHVKTFGADAVMTSPSCATGTDRMAEAIRHDRRFADVEIVVNVQGDEPCLEPEVITAVVEALREEPETLVATAVVPLTDPAEAVDRSVCKCVMSVDGHALYFSRVLIPAGKMVDFRQELPYFKHLGLYAYRRKFLLHYNDLTPTPLQQAEDLEQLKILEHGFRIKTIIVESNSHGVDTPEDLKRAERELCR